MGALGTHNALGLAKAKGARFFLASTSEVYGDPLVHPQPESYWGNVNPIGPRGVYDEAKRFAEAMTMAYHRAHGVDTRIVRIFNTYGPRMRPHDGRVVSNFIVQALKGEPLTMYGDGSQTRSFCYVDDEVEGIYRLFLHGDVRPMNIGNPREFTVRQLADVVLELTGSASPLTFRALPVDDPKVRQPDISRAREMLGWEPTGRASRRGTADDRVLPSGARAVAGAGLPRRSASVRARCRGARARRKVSDSVEAMHVDAPPQERNRIIFPGSSGTAPRSGVANRTPPVGYSTRYALFAQFSTHPCRCERRRGLGLLLRVQAQSLPDQRESLLGGTGRIQQQEVGSRGHGLREADLRPAGA